MKILVLKDIKGNVYAKSGASIENIEFKHVNQLKPLVCPPDFWAGPHVQEYVKAYEAMIAHLNELDDPTRILFGDGSCWYTECPIDDINFKFLDKDLIEIERCFSIDNYKVGE